MTAENGFQVQVVAGEIGAISNMTRCGSPMMIGAFASYVTFGFASDRMEWAAVRRSHSIGVLVIAFARGHAIR